MTLNPATRETSQEEGERPRFRFVSKLEIVEEREKNAARSLDALEGVEAEVGERRRVLEARAVAEDGDHRVSRYAAHGELLALLRGLALGF